MRLTALAMPCSSSGHEAAEMRIHARGVGFESREETEAAYRLADVHVPSIHHPAAGPLGCLEELRLERHIHDLRQPEVPVKQRRVERHARRRRHPGGSRMDEARRLLYFCFQIFYLKRLS